MLKLEENIKPISYKLKSYLK